MTSSGSSGRHAKWECICDCGNICTVSSSHLRCGDTKQCKECRDNNFKKSGIKHGLSKERLFSIWHGMAYRCYRINNKSYKNYGARGIYICDDWGAGDTSDIAAYLRFKEWALDNGYDDTLSIDRIDVDGPYSPDNCRWATFEEQKQNKTNTVYVETDQGMEPLVSFIQKSELNPGTIRKRIRNGMSVDNAISTPAENGRFIEFDGKRQSIRAWALEVGMKPATLLGRINAGWEVERAITEPVHKT